MTSQTATHEVHLERVLTATPERVWQALTDPAELSQWLAAAEVKPGPHGQFTLHFTHNDHVLNGQVIQWDEPHTLEYHWNPGHREASIVRFDLKPHPQGTLLTIQHRQLPASHAGEYWPGWQAHLDLLEGRYSGQALDFGERFKHWQKENA